MTEHELMLMSVRSCGRSELYLNPQELSATEEDLLREMTRRRETGEPLQYILGEWDFMGVRLNVDRRALIPRPETEWLIENALSTLREQMGPNEQGLNILDIGTGTGNIAIALAQHLPQATITAIDVSTDALDLAKRNADLNGVASRIKFTCLDMRQELSVFVADSFDVVISNPPYIPTGEIPSLPFEVQQEPCLALDGGEDGLEYYRAIVRNAGVILTPGGFLFLEIGHKQGDSVTRMINDTGKFSKIRLLHDFSDKERIVIARKDWHNESSHDNNR